MIESEVPLLWLTGPPCVGKSTIGWELFLQVMGSGTKAAYVDLEQIGFCYPTSDLVRLRARNLQVMWTNFRNAGARVFIVAGAVPDHGAFRSYVDDLAGTTPTLYRLRATPETLAARVLRRGQGIDPALPGDELRGRGASELRGKVQEAVHAAAQLDRLQLGEICIDADDRVPSEIASVIRQRAGL